MFNTSRVLAEAKNRATSPRRALRIALPLIIFAIGTLALGSACGGSGMGGDMMDDGTGEGMMGDGAGGGMMDDGMGGGMTGESGGTPSEEADHNPLHQQMRVMMDAVMGEGFSERMHAAMPGSEEMMEAGTARMLDMMDGGMGEGMMDGGMMSGP